MSDEKKHDHLSIDPALIPEGRKEAYELAISIVQDISAKTHDLVVYLMDRLSDPDVMAKLTPNERLDALILGCAEITHELKHCYIELEELTGQPLQRHAVQHLLKLGCGIFKTQALASQEMMAKIAANANSPDAPVHPSVAALLDTLMKGGGNKKPS